MDVLSDAVAGMRTGQPHSARVSRSGSFGQRFPPVEGAGFHILLSGTCWLFPPEGDPVSLASGDIAFLPRGSAHALADNSFAPTVDASATAAAINSGTEDSAPKTTMICGAYFADRTRSHPLLHELPDVVHVSSRAEQHPALRSAVQLLDMELERAGPGSAAMLPALLDVLLLHMLRAWLDEQPSDGAQGWVAALQDPCVASALRAIHREPANQWSVTELGTRAGLSRAAFARRFASLVGRPPLAYLTWWRMTLAAQLLRGSDVPLASVAESVGYSSEFAFAHAFKREHGQAPGRFRRSVRSAATPSD